MIRAFKQEDLDQIMALWFETNRSAHAFIAEAYWIKNFDAVKDMMPNASISIYEEGDAIHGFIGLLDDYIAGLFVSENRQSAGIGKALLDDAKRKNKQLSLHVYQRNQRAVRFYAREGFLISSEQVEENTQESEFRMVWVK